jgi:hypothetical protein
VSFLYPLFLIAGLTLAIPILIHLFNLRRYKTVLFPHTRFLKSIQLKSQKQSKVRYKWLLAMRLLFLLLLILAFAQPFLGSNKGADTKDKLQVIYIDNSASMSLKKGARSLLDISKDAARARIRAAAPGTRFVLLTNDKPVSYQALPIDRALSELNTINISPATKNAAQVVSLVHTIMLNESAADADLYYFSDFQRSGFQGLEQKDLDHITFYGMPVQATATSNIYIDTAYINAPVLQTGMDNQVIVRTVATGKLPANAPVVQLAINGQVKSASTLRFNEQNISIDTLSFQVGDAGWQRMALAVNDAAIRFDDTFLIAARNSPSLSVLVLNGGQSSPYIQAAFRAYNGFRLNQIPAAQAPANLNEYNLVILNDITAIDAALAQKLTGALNSGQTICIFPGRTGSYTSLNEGLSQLGDIQITGIDTARQTVSSLQQGNTLVKDLFEKIPENVQLPLTNWHYIINAGLAANQQSIMSFRNGDPFLARYTPSRGQLYICATSADLQSGNFAASYFFVPFLYQMAMQSKGGDIYAITAGRQQSVYLPMDNANERNMVHVSGNGIDDAIPQQVPGGAGLNVYLDELVKSSGFYSLYAQGNDSAVVAVNQERTESNLDVWSPADLKNQWKGANISWVDYNKAGENLDAGKWANFPLWKVCAILALLMLAVETYLLAGGFRKQTIPAQ